MNLSQHVATRDRSIDFAYLGMLLPNPDPVLKARGIDIKTYRDMRADALVGGSIRRRKSAVRALQWGLERGNAASRVSKAVTAMLDALDMELLIGQAMEAVLYGYQPMEVIWQRQADGLWVPQEVVAKPPEWFGFDGDNQLRFKTRTNQTLGEKVSPRKFLLPRQEPTYANPYGVADLSMCFWPLVFKKGGLKFWLGFAEKFGSAFSVGKLPRNAAPEERARLLDNLDALIQNGVAVIPEDGSVEIIEASGKSASAELYERLVLHCRSEIAIAMLGQNQTTEASANKASASAGLEVTAELRDADAEIVSACVNQLVQWICELNFGGGPAPKFSMWDQASRDEMQAARDKSVYEAGARFTRAYWMRTYQYEDGDLAPDAPLPGQGAAQGDGQGTQGAQAQGVKLDKPKPGSAEDDQAQSRAAEFAQAALADPATTVDPADPTAAFTDELTRTTDPAWSAVVDRLQALVDQATSIEQLQAAIARAYGGIDTQEITRLMAAAMALAELKGLADVRSDSAQVADPRSDE